jgi:hypothetical protein
MNKNLPVPQDNALQPFLQQYGSDVIGNLSGFDRLRLRGTLRSLYHGPVMERYLSKCHVRLLDFKGYVRQISQRVCAGARALAARLGRPYHHEPSCREDKEAFGCAARLGSDGSSRHPFSSGCRHETP